MKPINDIAIVGRACRLPGAATVADLWSLLASGGCAVTSIPADRWSLEPFAHPRAGERGRSYTWAAGCLDDIWGFDPGAFGMSPREADMIDPQQRLLLELTWEALEDAGIGPSSLAGTDTGVFIGVSSVDHSNLRILDMSSADAYMMTGNTLSIVANRVSHVFDLRGPSLIVDTACSSSLVALNEAIIHLRSGRIETAIVGGVSILATPHAFIGFSQAAMLSRRGLCQAFSAEADGYVRAEGGVVLVLQTRTAAERSGTPIHAFVAATDVNSDGRTNGISLPSRGAQVALLERLYRDIDLDDLAFVEAHGTGTPVGDPIEAQAIGAAIATRRARPLLIGSIKTNIGHTEAASGLAGVLKAMLALEHGAVPASLHSEHLNPEIDFSALNLEVARVKTRLPNNEGRPRLAGVNSFGFGGTNAHALLAEGPSTLVGPEQPPPRFFVISAHSRTALDALVADYAARLDNASERDAAAIMATAVHKRDLLPERVVVPVTTRTEVAAMLSHFGARDTKRAGLARGTALGRVSPVAFVFSGNGSQFAGMGLPAYKYNAAFREALDGISRQFEKLAGWSIVEALHAKDLAARLELTRIAQPLLFAIQSAAQRALRADGLEPDFVIGHSVGEVAAAEAAGILDETGALRTILARSLHQEITRDTGGMAVVFGARQALDQIIADLPGLSIAARNAPRAFTLSGSQADLALLPEVARRRGARVRKLDLAYPFHHALMAAVEAPLLRDLADLPHASGTVGFISTVTGGLLDGADLEGAHWWRNVREPVLFADAVATAIAKGARILVEIGPAPTLVAPINEIADEGDTPIAGFAALDKSDRGVDPIAEAVATAISRGAEVDKARAFGIPPAPGSRVPLPSYPWQRKCYRLATTADSVSNIEPTNWHPLIGARSHPDRFEWHATLDLVAHPTLADHCVDGRAILPGAAFVEMALAVAREWLGGKEPAIVDLEIVSPMPLSDTGRDVMCRLTPLVAHLDILSRPRLSRMPWHSHARAKILREPTIGTMPEGPSERDPPNARRREGADLYAIADRRGLHYGPAFRKLRTAATPRPDRIVFELTGEPGDAGYGLDPARLDACFHALLLIPEEADRGTPFVPVRFDEIVLRHPGEPFTRGRIDILRRDDRAITANMLLTNDVGETIALIRGARFQAIPPARTKQPVSLIHPTWILASEPTASRGDRPFALSTLRRGIAPRGESSKLADGFVLLEGWATSLALRLARDLATGAMIDVDTLVADGRLPARAKPWLETILSSLERSDLCRGAHNGFRLDANIDLPEPREILRDIARTHQELSAELLVAAGTMSAATQLSGGRAERRPQPLSSKVIDGFELGSHSASAAARHLVTLVRRATGRWPGDRAMRILQIGFGPLSMDVLRLAEDTKARLTIFDLDRRRLELARVRFADRREIDVTGDVRQLPASGVDLVLASNALHRHHRAPGFWADIRRAMAPAAILAAIEPAPSLFRDLALGLAACVGEENTTFDGISVGEAEWRDAMQTATLGDAAVASIDVEGTPALLLTGQVEATRRVWSASGTALIIGDGHLRTRSAFATLLASCGLHVSLLLDGECGADRFVEAPAFVVVFARDDDAGLGPVQRLGRRCMHLKHIAELIGPRPTILWLVTSGALDLLDDRGAEIAGGLWAFSRTLANEIPHLDIRRVDVASDISADAVAERLRDLVLSKTDETDVSLQRDATRVLRFEPRTAGASERCDFAPAAALRRAEGAGLDRLSWQPIERKPPGAREVEIRVEAVGLNFRDVMLGLGLLPDESLEHGFAGATLGLECAGRVERVGSAVKGLCSGDRVMAFAKAAFATHVTTAAAMVAPIPDELSFEKAATIPVVFLTAYHALIQCARVRPGEWVLIHGGAGGVGLAALQIALWRGARVIATAGSRERRAMLTALGAEHAFDSRSLSFVDDVRRTTGEGVGVVLNSLCDEAMERSIAVLRTFGRFVELGKRDFVANTHIGLRPFRRNLSYFGVDLDQSLTERPARSKALLRAVMRLFARGELVPLPFRSFDAEDATAAFRLMQHSGHVGKLVMRPPRLGGTTRRAPLKVNVAADKVHLVTGGFGGFGLETARWLADRGARHIMLMGRRGAASDEARDALSWFAAGGITIWAEACDVADKVALAAVFAQCGGVMPPLGGIIHAAMALDDAAMANLTEERLERVLRPKVAGADHLDRLTRDLDLDYFVLYSSATTLIGNPGQAAYVAANGYLEGVARRRRAVGLPGLAIAWGAIGDVGALARTDATREALAARVGLDAMPARAALDVLGELFDAPARGGAEAVVAIAPVAWSASRAHLPVLKSPVYRQLLDQHEASAHANEKLDLASLTARTNPDELRRLTTGLIVEEVCRVLRLPREEVSRTGPLSEIGLDSLMAVELAVGIEGRIVVTTPLAITASGFSINELDDLLALATGRLREEDAMSDEMIRRHLPRHVDPTWISEAGQDAGRPAHRRVTEGL